MDRSTVLDGITTLATFDTKPTDKSAVVYTHTLEFDWSGLTVDEVLEVGKRSLVIDAQRRIRSAVKNGKPLPYPKGTTTKVKVSDFVKPVRTTAAPPAWMARILAADTPEKRREVVKSLSPEERELLLTLASSTTDADEE